MRPFTLLLAAAALLCAATAVQAQQFAQPSFSFSHKKPAYVTLTDGTTLEGEIKDLDRKKGLIEEVKIKDTSGKKHKLDPEEIKHMYLAPSGWDNMTNALDKMYDTQRWDEDLDANKLKEGYVYFETVPVMVKKKQRTLLMQLLNPATATGIRVYHDPYAKETMSAGVGGFTLAGGDAKSYYVMRDGKPAYRLYKKTYDDQYASLYAGCDNVLNDENAMRWSSFQDHVNNYAACN